MVLGMADFILVERGAFPFFITRKVKLMDSTMADNI